MAVLTAACTQAKAFFPRQPWICTITLARAVWSITPTTLPNVCRSLGITLKHHDAASDAAACATIVCAAWHTNTGRSRLAGFCRR